MIKLICAMNLAMALLPSYAAVNTAFFSAEDFSQYYHDANNQFAQGLTYGFLLSALPQYLRTLSHVRSKAYAKCWMQAYNFGDQTAPQFLRAFDTYIANYPEHAKEDATRVFDLAMTTYYPPTDKVLACEKRGKG